jgi:glycosyltransferase involved in cell wall biosynthesis
MPDPLVSILITSYNHEKYIRQAIEGCLMQQTSFPYEIIIHDDASTDSSAQIIQEYADKYPELIIPILQKENQYSKAVRIMATLMVPIARGKYIAFCEGDDYWTDPKKLEKQITIMEKDPLISLCFTATKWVFVNGKKRDKIMRYHHGNHFFSSDEVIMRSGGFTDVVSTIVRKDIYQNIGSWFDLSPAGDVALYLLALMGGTAYYLDEVTAVYHRGVENSWTTNIHKKTSYEKNFLEKSISMKDAFDEYSSYQFNISIQRRNNLDIMSLSFIFDDEKKFREEYFHRFSPSEKVEYFVFHKLFPIKPRFFWHRYHDILRYFGLW